MGREGVTRSLSAKVIWIPLWRWLDYATERKGRFVGLQNKDGSKKQDQLPGPKRNSTTSCPIAKRDHLGRTLRSWDLLFGVF